VNDSFSALGSIVEQLAEFLVTGTALDPIDSFIDELGLLCAIAAPVVPDDVYGDYFEGEESFAGSDTDDVVNKAGCGAVSSALSTSLPLAVAGLDLVGASWPRYE
jgi:hypothetical protein